MMLKAFEHTDTITEINWFERPSLPHELANEIFRPNPPLSTKLRIHKEIDFNLLSAFRNRGAHSAISFKILEQKLRKEVSKQGERNILLDFNPFYIPPLDIVKSGIYWYDLIDNFTKHNRFNSASKQLVARKYEFVKKHADFVTGVTDAAVSPFNGLTVENRLLNSNLTLSSAEPKYDIGYLGFITDKFDVAAVRAMAEKGLTFLICGHAYDKGTLAEIRSISGVTYSGAFSAEDVPNLVAQFRAGIIPYINEKLHDGSPIKFYQYIAQGRPVLLCDRFSDIESQFKDVTLYYNEKTTSDVVKFAEDNRNNFANITLRIATRARNLPELFWENCIDDLIDCATRIPNEPIKTKKP